MVQKYVHAAFPLKDCGMMMTEQVKIPLCEKTIYDALGYFEDNIFKKSRFNIMYKQSSEEIELNNIINLHDEEAMDIMKIKRLKKTLLNGDHILTKSKMPNIKLIKSPRKEWVIFDGHHTLISYMLMNRKYLHEVPYLVIDSELGFFNDRSILQFFGKHSKKLIDKDWRDYVINWNNGFEDQLCKRKRLNMFELSSEVGKYC